MSSCTACAGDGPLQRAETQHRALEDNMKAFEEARLVVEQARADLAAAEQSFGKSVEQVLQHFDN